MSDHARKGILPPPSPEATKRASLHSYDDDEPNSLGPTTSMIPPPPPPAPMRPSMSAGQRLSSLLPPAARKSIQSMLPVARKSIQSMLPVWKPRWRPWSPARALGAVSAFAVAFGFFMYAAYPGLVKYAQRFHVSGIHLSLSAPAVQPVVVPVPEEKIETGGDADKNLKRDGRSPVAGGVLSIPASFRSGDGAYDLFVFFHGNTNLVEESIGAAKVNAVVLIYNLGIGSGVYEDKFSIPGLMPEILDRVKTTMAGRGLETPHLRRLALGAWSAGYGAVEKILEQPAMAEKADAVILLDGIHVGYMVDGRSLDMLRLKAFSDYAKRAVDGEKLFYITHSNIVPTGYAGTRETTDAVLKAVGVQREKLTEAPVMPILTSLVGVVAKDKVKSLRPVSQAHKGLLSVCGYQGETPEDHMSHLMQMSETALPALVEYWSKPAKK
jgi:hypothetical protein